MVENLVFRGGNKAFVVVDMVPRRVWVVFGWVVCKVVELQVCTLVWWEVCILVWLQVCKACIAVLVVVSLCILYKTNI